MQTSSSKALIANYKILLTEYGRQQSISMSLWRQRAVSPVPSCSLMSHCAVIRAQGACAGLCPTHAHSHPACRVSDSPAPPGLSLEAGASQGSCGAKLLHGIFGMAWLGSEGSQRCWQGLLCVPWSCAVASVCFVDCSKLFFLCAKGFYGYLVAWLG